LARPQDGGAGGEADAPQREREGGDDDLLLAPDLVHEDGAGVLAGGEDGQPGGPVGDAGAVEAENLGQFGGPRPRLSWARFPWARLPWGRPDPFDPADGRQRQGQRPAPGPEHQRAGGG